MNQYEMRKVLQVLIAFCVVIILVGGVYYLAEYRASGRPRAAARPATTAMPMMPQEPVEMRGFEGVMTPNGFAVTALDGGGRRAGLQVGDIIRDAAGQPVRDPAQLRAWGADVPLGIERRGQLQRLSPQGGPTALPPPEARPIDVRGIDGRLTRDGLWINAVDGDARRWGLRRGDLLRTVNGQPLMVRREATALLRGLDPAGGLTFEIVRDGARLYLPYTTAQPGFAGGLPTTPQANPAMGPARGGQHQHAMSPGAAGRPGRGWMGLGGTYCSACGALHPPGFASNSCWRCGSALGNQAAPLPGAPGGGVQQLPATAAVQR